MPTSLSTKLKQVLDTVLSVDNKSGEVQNQTYSGVSVHGLRILPRFSPCKTLSERWLNLQDLILHLKVKTCFDCKMFDEALSVSPQGTLEISSVFGQPPYLGRDHFSTPRVLTESRKRDKGCGHSSKRPQYPNLYRRLKRRLGHSLRASLYKGLWSDR